MNVHRRSALAFAALCCALPALALALDAPARFQQGCETERFSLRSDFPGGRVSACTRQSATHIEVLIAPEDAPPINDSAWYAFRLDPHQPGFAVITLRYENGTHRYKPWFRELKAGEAAWRLLDQVETLPDGALRLQVALEDAPVLVAAQELLLPDAYTKWLAELAGRHGLRQAELGRSALGRPLFRLEIGDGEVGRRRARAVPVNGVGTRRFGASDRRRVRATPVNGLDATREPRGTLLLLGRQHPPEVTGAFALFAFTERLTEPDALAATFRARFRVHLVPLLNPDGVARGHWRHGAGGVDLNRDWGPFTQPETRGVKTFLEEHPAQTAALQLMLDFHSTYNDLIYTQQDEERTTPARFHRNWFACLRLHDADGAVAARVPREPRRTGEQPNAKNYFHHRFGIPTATYEVGDATPRPEIRANARAFAEAMMRTLLHRDGCGDAQETK